MNSQKTIEERIQHLPIDIIRYIIPMTYQVQEKKHLDNICNYYICRKQIQSIYHEYWITKMNGYDGEDTDWIINNLEFYFNEYNATSYYGYNDFTHELFRRFFKMRHHTDIEIDHYFDKIFKGFSSTRQVNLFLGVLTPEERTIFIDNCMIFM